MTHEEDYSIVELSDGTRIVIRPIQPNDAAELKRQFERLSPASRFARFLAPVERLSDETLRYLTHVDGTNHVALVATLPSHDMKGERGLGVARFIRLKDAPNVAEAAVTVAEDARNRGIARILLAKLAHAARERGIDTFRAEVLVANAPMRHLLAEVGAEVRERDGDALVFDVSLGPPIAPPDAGHPLRRLLRAIAEQIAAFGRN